MSTCPFSTLTTLVLLVAGPTMPPVSRPILLAIPVAAADLGLQVWRRVR